MSQNDMVISNQSAPAFRADLNSALQALASVSSGATEPATKYANQLWYDTGTNTLKKRNESNSAWIEMGTFDEGAGTFTPTGQYIPATQTQATWNTGTSTTESVISPAKLGGVVGALAKGAPGAPIVRAGWHPFDADKVGPNASGVIYDFATDGAVSAVVSPTLPLGYEYMAVWCDIRSTKPGGISPPQLLVELSYWANPSNYIDSLNAGNIFTASGAYGDQYSNGYISLSALSEKTYLRSFGYFVSGSTTANVEGVPSSSVVTRRPVGGLSNIRFRPTGYNLNFGKIWLLRRREYISA